MGCVLSADSQFTFGAAITLLPAATQVSVLVGAIARKEI